MSSIFCPEWEEGCEERRAERGRAFRARAAGSRACVFSLMVNMFVHLSDGRQQKFRTHDLLSVGEGWKRSSRLNWRGTIGRPPMPPPPPPSPGLLEASGRVCEGGRGGAVCINSGSAAGNRRRASACAPPTSQAQRRRAVAVRSSGQRALMRAAPLR